ncbi:transporter substrate-binding domain-containing protein [Rugamonas sp. FT82W]|uniref:Transporter substrate-binding domain-containing protein n=1 Tax=Duganella vulcania TaxID=2692166 RepID=A0A845FZ39_9BURK|nr:transporter substrate-binding domain-containing protein [Duganella vulcania]MYM86560.1 transporter substrate-binding domain-containing protein [Duganella vulcania]
MSFQRAPQLRAQPGEWLFFSIMLAIAGVLGFDACAQASAMPEVLVGMGLPKPPYIMESGTAGLDYDIARQAMAAGGYKMVGRSLPQTRALAMLRAGQLDGMLSTTEGIGGHDFFTDPYIVYQNVATTLTSRRLILRQIEDLSGYSVVAFQNASMVLGERYSLTVSGHPDYREVPSQITQNKLLFTGRVDVVVGDRLIFRYFSNKLDPQIDATKAVTFHRIFPDSPRKAVFRDARMRDAFNAGLKIIRANGAYDAIVSQYIGAGWP